MPKRKNTKKPKAAKAQPSTVTFRLNPDLKAKLAELAEQEYTSESALCNRFISQMLEADVPSRLTAVEDRLAKLEAQPRDLLLHLAEDRQQVLALLGTAVEDAEADEADANDADEGKNGTAEFATAGSDAGDDLDAVA